jgi:hypothetical protein
MFPLLLTLTTPAAALQPIDGPLLNQHADGPQLTLSAELGFQAVLAHRIRFSNYGSLIDYVDEGGQDVLFAFKRASGDVALGADNRHHVGLLYQPLSLVTEEVADRELTVNDTVFPAGTPMTYRYDFPFWRASYHYDFASDPEKELGFGLSLQIRNATIGFSSQDGALYEAERDIGPVPVLRFRGRTATSADGWWLGGEVDGFYAPIKYLNGDNNDVVGAIADASVRVGRQLNGAVDGYLNVRYLGGGAEGTSDNEDGRGDGYTENWLHFLTLSLGFSLR